MWLPVAPVLVPAALMLVWLPVAWFLVAWFLVVRPPEVCLYYS